MKGSASSLACADTLVYDVSAYYEALAEVAANGFTPKERAEEKHAKFLAGFAAGISSAADVGPMAKALTMQYNRARQSQITTELSEIMGGVEAMKG